MGRVGEFTSLEDRREEFIKLSEDYWKYYFDNKDGGDMLGRVMIILKKKESARNKAAGKEFLDQNVLPLSERRKIDEEIKRDLRTKNE
jgi:hypothetical protein